MPDNTKNYEQHTPLPVGFAEYLAIIVLTVKIFGGCGSMFIGLMMGVLSIMSMSQRRFLLDLPLRSSTYYIRFDYQAGLHELQLNNVRK